ncbi:MAG: DMT family transporter [Gammaproteobacteria bacterium]|nr:DMT family transporter [Gammaproteobacteria bacterium]
MKVQNVKSHLLVILATILVAGSFLASEKLAGIINPISLTLLRFIGAGLILSPIIFSNPRWRREVLTTLPRAMIISLFFSVFFICFFESLNTTTALNTGALYTLVPLITALLCMLIFGEGMAIKQIAVYLLGAAGTSWVIFNGQFNLLLSFSLNKGDLIFMVGTFSMCCYSITMKLLYRNDEMVVLVFCTLVGGSLWMALALLFSGQPLQWDLLQGELVYYMAYLVIGATLATVYIYQKTTVVLGPSRVNAYIYLTPALVAVLLLLIDGVSIPMAVAPGILISSIATVILQKNHSQEKTAITAKKT